MIWPFCVIFAGEAANIDAATTMLGASGHGATGTRLALLIQNFIRSAATIRLLRSDKAFASRPARRYTTIRPGTLGRYVSSGWRFAFFGAYCPRCAQHARFEGVSLLNGLCDQKAGYGRIVAIVIVPRCMPCSVIPGLRLAYQYV